MASTGLARNRSGRLALNDHDTEVLTIQDGAIVMAPQYAGSDSYQPIAADLNLDAGAGADAGDSAFLGAMMGNVLGDALTKVANFVGGLIGALSVTGVNAAKLQVAAVLGIVMDGVTDADGAVVAVIDGSDPSSETRANAAFAARMNNNHASSGVDYGLDLYDPGRSSDVLTGALALPIAKAAIRMDRQVCVLTGAGVPSDGTTGDNFAGPGSLYVDVTNANLYVQTSLITTPVWKLVTRAS